MVRLKLIMLILSDQKTRLNQVICHYLDKVKNVVRMFSIRFTNLKFNCKTIYYSYHIISEELSNSLMVINNIFFIIYETIVLQSSGIRHYVNGMPITLIAYGVLQELNFIKDLFCNRTRKFMNITYFRFCSQEALSSPQKIYNML